MMSGSSDPGFYDSLDAVSAVPMVKPSLLQVERKKLSLVQIILYHKDPLLHSL
jgi:hypothetical protein